MTGRPLSPPNLQNIPIRTPEGCRIREAFVVPVTLEVDYSEVERELLERLGLVDPTSG